MRNNVILTDKLLIYNNRGSIGSVAGGLSVTYEFFPAPALFWEFEVFNEQDAQLEYKATGELLHSIEGHEIVIPAAWFENQRVDANPRRELGYRRTGVAAKVYVGDRDRKGKSFTFWLPNCKFQEIELLLNSVTREISHRTADESPQNIMLGWRLDREAYLQTDLKGETKLSLHTPTEALEWLRSQGSTGTYLTTVGTLDLSSEISITDAANLLEEISDLLSFANGGFIAPLIIQMAPLQFERDYPTLYSAYAIDSVEYLGGSWPGTESDTAALMQCFTTYQKMLKTPHWENNFHLVLIWYFQAVQPQGVQLRGKPWPVCATALGAALEKLASIILVEEMHVLSSTKFKKASLEDRIRRLLNTIGLPDVGPEYMTGGPNGEAKDAVWYFVKMRNDATHHKSSRVWTLDQVHDILSTAIQWTEEVLLWRLGYQGKYRNRIRDRWSCTEPRYDLSLRDSSW